ncbi:glycosyltransferase family 4 protein [Leucobacter iarius]|uniref:D-inositol 3-phosphate glycosyltransferase n=1 Tax=Leucobacter iarius TaxID=333963 RepID=A0ABP4XFL3_9MICO
MSASTARPRITVVTPWFPTNASPGAGIFVLRDVELLAEHAEVTVVHVGAPQFFDADLANEPEWPGFRTVRAPFAFSDYRSLAAAASAVRRELRGAQLLHTMAMGALTPLVGTRVRVPWVHTEHWSGLLRDPEGSGRSRLVQRFLRRQLRRPDRVVAVSGFLAGALQRWSGSAPAVIGNAVMVPSVPVSDSAWDFSEVALLGVGAIADNKGPMEALETMIELRRRGRSATLTWVGSGPLAQRMRERAEEAGVAEHLRLPGQLEPDAVAGELAAADLFLLPTRFETFGVALAEAASAGLPIVTGDRGGFLDFLDSDSSRLVPVDRFGGPALADAVEALVDDPALPARTAIASTAAERFDEGARWERYARVYREAGLRPPEANGG